MNRSIRRKSFALCFTNGLVSLAVGAYAAEASAQALEPLRIDPALLGLPPAERGRSAPEAPQRARPAPAATPEPATRATPKAAGETPPKSAETAASPIPPAKERIPTRARTSKSERSWFQKVWAPLENAYDNGDWEFYLPVRTHHLRSKYAADKIANYQESPLGFGIGRGGYDEKGNWDGIYAMAFQDSHFKPMYAAGYSWKAIWRPAGDWRLGLGYTAGLMSRTDIGHYIPFPIVLPVVSVAYKNLNLETSFVPGTAGAGNIFFIWAKWEFGKPGVAVGTPVPPEPLAFAGHTEHGAAESAIFTTSGSAVAPAALRPHVPYGPTLAEPAEALPPAKALSPASGPRRSEEAAEAMAPALALRASREMAPPAKDKREARPAFLSAQRLGGRIERELNAEGNAELRKIGQLLSADRLTYWPIEDEVEAEGRVRLQQNDDVLTGPKMRLKLEDQLGYFEQPEYRLRRGPAPGSAGAERRAYAAQFAAKYGAGETSWWNSGFEIPRPLSIQAGQTELISPARGRPTIEGRGKAERIDFEGENHVRMSNASYTTCSLDKPDWYVRARDLTLDYDEEVGEGKDATVYFKDLPFFYSPWLSFSLNDERKSGFLLPTFGSNNKSGFEYTQPYYWNIAPNRDATISPKLMTRRGVQLNSEFRYLDTLLGGTYAGDVKLDLLPNDRLRKGDRRYAFAWQHVQPSTRQGFSGSISYNKVSDDQYFTDLSSAITSTAQTQMLQQGVLTYGGSEWWNATANFQQYQTLQPDPANPVMKPYKLLPQLSFNARKPDYYQTDSHFFAQYTSFKAGARQQFGKIYPDGQRTVLYPQIAVPYVTPGWYVTPKFGLNYRHYALSGQTPGTPGAQSYALPVVSVDSGMNFERSSRFFGHDYTQTLEPRLYYLNVPYRNQDNIPLFDTGLADFNFAQIFSENQFSNWDRFSNANQLTTGLTSRLIEPATGYEILRGMLGQRFYFTRNKVGLTTASALSTNRQWDKSDFLAAFNGQILPRIYADTALQYNGSDRQVKRYSLGLRYQPEPGKVLNAAYRYNRDQYAPLDQVDFSGQWPLSGRWHAVGRFNYSFKDDGTVLANQTQKGRLIESLAGLEYNGGCWVVRGVVQRQALTRDKASTSFFIQLELNGFARVGSSPIKLLQRHIQGYSLINQPLDDSAFNE